MKSPRASPAPPFTRLSALQYSLTYAVVTSLWIFFSDRLIGAFVSDPATLVRVSSLKGFLFVGVTSLLLFTLLERRRSVPLDTELEGERSTWLSPALAVLLFSLAVAATGIAVYQAAKRSVTQSASDNLAAVAKLKVGQIERWLGERRDDVKLIVDAPLFAAELQQWLNGGHRDDEHRARLLDHLRRMAEISHYRHVTLRNPADGAPLLTTSGLSDSPKRRARAAAAARQGGPVLDDFRFAGEADDSRIALGLFDTVRAPRTAQPLALVHVALDPADLLYPLLQQWPGASASAETLLLRREGDDVVYLNILRHRADTALRLRLPLATPQLPSAQAIHGRLGAIRGRDYRDVPVLAYALPVKGTPWFMVAKIDEAEVYGGLDALAAEATAVVAILLLVAGWWWAERSRFAAARYRSQLERAMLAKRLDYLAKDANDCVMTLDRNGRIIDVNDRSLATYGYSREEMLAMNGAELRPPQRRADFPALLQQLAQQGSVTLEIEHCRKDGRAFPVEITARRVDSGGERCFQEIVRDISERKNAEARIVGLSRLYAAISATNRAIVRSHSPQEVFQAVCRACVDHGGFKMAWVGLADPERRRIVVTEAYGAGTDYLDGVLISTEGEVAEGRGPTGTAYREGRVVICNDFAADPSTAPWRGKAARYGFHSSIALPLRRGGEVVGVLSAYGGQKNFFDDQALKLFTEMAESISFANDLFDREAQRRQAEEALRQSEARLREAQALGKIGDWELDLQTKRMTWSREVFRLFERDPASGAPDPEEAMAYFFPESDRLTREGARRAITTGERVEIEQAVRLPSGRAAHHATVMMRGKPVGARATKLYGTVQDITERKKLETERADYAKRLEDLSRHLVAVQEEERRRLAVALHDRASPNLAAIKINLATTAAELPPQAMEEIEARLDDSRALLDDTIAGIREICAELRPVLLDYAGLLPALEAYAQQFGHRTGIAVRVASRGPPVKLTAELESVLFRIAQEALTNCAKHAQAQRVDVELSDGGRCAVLTVSDDGVGFDPDRLGQAEHAPGLGLLTMRERAEFAGGRLSIASAPGKGTRIRFEIEADRRAGGMARRSGRSPWGADHDDAHTAGR